MHSYLEWLPHIAMTVLGMVPLTIVLAVVFAFLTWRFPCNSVEMVWGRRELVADLCWWFIFPLLARYMNLVLLVFGGGLLVLVFRIPEESVDLRFAPLANVPFWGQVGLYFI